MIVYAHIRDNFHFGSLASIIVGECGGHDRIVRCTVLFDGADDF
jgi:hypothetical protein